jgi:hypothetical protein
MQEAFALPPAQARAAPAGSTTSVLVQDQTFDIYVHRWGLTVCCACCPACTCVSCWGGVARSNTTPYTR